MCVMREHIYIYNVYYRYGMGKCRIVANITIHRHDSILLIHKAYIRFLCWLITLVGRCWLLDEQHSIIIYTYVYSTIVVTLHVYCMLCYGPYIIYFYLVYVYVHPIYTLCIYIISCHKIEVQKRYLVLCFV